MSSTKEIAEKIVKNEALFASIGAKVNSDTLDLARAYLELLSENEAIEKIYRMNRRYVEDSKAEITKLKKSREGLRSVCEFYASSDQWNCTKEQLTTYNTIDKDDLGVGDFQFTCDVDDDRVGGKKAREAIKADDDLMKEGGE